MHIRQVLRPALALALLFFAGPAVTRSVPTPVGIRRRRRDPDTIALVQMVDAAISLHRRSRPATLRKAIFRWWDSVHLIRGQNGVYVPLPSPSIRRRCGRRKSAFISARLKESAPGGRFGIDASSCGQQAGAVHAAEIFVGQRELHAEAGGRPHHAGDCAASGDYELFVAVKERSSVPAAAAAKPPPAPLPQPRTGLLRHAVLAPDFRSWIC